MRAFLLLFLLARCGDSGPSPAQAAPIEPIAAPAEGAEAGDASAAERLEERPVEAAIDAFFGEPDGPVLEALRTEAVRRVRPGRGGRSLAFRITLESGREAYFKPEQNFSGAHWYSEIAAYHLDRLLGFGRVAPVTGRTICWRLLERAAEQHPRASEIVLDDNGCARGALIAWIDGPLRGWPLGEGWEHFVRVEGNLEISPFQRPADYRAQVSGRLLREETELGGYPPAPETLTTEERAQLSDLIVFDFLISNVDRWGGSYTNVRRRGSEQLVFLDQGAGFWPGARLGLMDARLRALQQIRPATEAALRRFDLAAYQARLESDPLAPVLNERRLVALAARVEAALEHIEDLRERFGDAIELR